MWELLFVSKCSSLCERMYRYIVDDNRPNSARFKLRSHYVAVAYSTAKGIMDSWAVSARSTSVVVAQQQPNRFEPSRQRSMHSCPM
jgi:hypothetical protein